MSRVQEIAIAIEQLPRSEVFELAELISSKCSDEWDKEIEEDIKAGRLDVLARQAILEFREGKTTPFPHNEE